MPISIRFLTTTDIDLDQAVGELTIDGFTESFDVPLHYWSRDDYERQWNEGLKRIDSGASRSCLITSMSDPAHANFIVWWIIYREGRQLFLQNQLLFLERLVGEFDESNPYQFIQDRVTTDPDGGRISEWVCEDS